MHILKYYLMVLFWILLFGMSSAASAQEKRGEMFVDIDVESHQVYVGEVFRVEYDVYVSSSRGQVFYEVKDPEFVEWYSYEEKPGPSSVVTVDGRMYTKEPFAVYYVAAWHPGDVSLPSLSVQVPFETGKPWTSNAPRTVRVLPRHEKPQSVKGDNVGQFEIEARLASESMHVGDVLTFEVTVRSDSPSQRVMLEDYELGELAGIFEVYPWIRDRAEDHVEHHRFRSESVYRLRLLAKQAGTWQLPPVRLVTFDPEARQYREVSRDLGEAAVLPGEKNAMDEGAIGYVSQKAVETKDMTSGKRGWPVFAVMAAVLLVGAGAWFYRRRNRE